MRMKFSALLTAGLLVAGLAGIADASYISSFDLTKFNFDVTAYSPVASDGLAGNSTASGTSNGIGWTISPTNLWTGRTTTNGSFQFSTLPIRTDNLHASSNFTITFDKVISNLLVALDNDGSGNDSINFGLTPTEWTSGIAVNGTQLTLNPAGYGGLALFTNIQSLTVSHTNTNYLDGFDMAFHAEAAPVPEPSTFLLVGAGLVGVGLFRRRTKKLV